MTWWQTVVVSVSGIVIEAGAAAVTVSWRRRR
jgi:hypothetical protein